MNGPLPATSSTLNAAALAKVGTAIQLAAPDERAELDLLEDPGHAAPMSKRRKTRHDGGFVMVARMMTRTPAYQSLSPRAGWLLCGL